MVVDEKVLVGCFKGYPLYKAVITDTNSFAEPIYVALLLGVSESAETGLGEDHLPADRDSYEVLLID